MKFIVNGTDQQSTIGVYPPKPTYGWRAVLVKEEEPAAELNAQGTSAAAPQMPVICAVDAKGQFCVEEGQSYRVCSFTEPPVKRQTPSDRNARRREARKERKQQAGTSAPPVQVVSSTYPQFLGMFLRCFQNVSARDANAEWHRMSKETRRGRSAKELAKIVKESSGYQLSEEGLTELK